VVREAVNDRVLDQRLKDETRHPDGGHVGALLDVNAQAICETPELQAEIELAELELIPQLRVVTFPGPQQAPQQVAEGCDQALGHLRLAADARLNGVEHVEERVGGELGAQGGEARARPIAPQLGAAQLERVVAPPDHRHCEQGQPETVGEQPGHRARDPYSPVTPGKYPEGLCGPGVQQTHDAVGDEHRPVHEERECECHRDLLRDAPSRRPPADARRGGIAKQQQRQHQRVLHYTVLPGEEDHDAGHLGDFDTHRLVVDDVAQRDVGPEEGDEQQQAGAGGESFPVLGPGSGPGRESGGDGDHVVIMAQECCASRSCRRWRGTDQPSAGTSAAFLGTTARSAPGAAGTARIRGNLRGGTA